MEKTYLVTGGAGFIGSHCVDQLISRGDRVVVLDKVPAPDAHNLRKSFDHLTYIEGDVRDIATVMHTMKGITHVLHLAALVSVPISLKEPLLAHENNVTGTFNVLEGARANGIKRLVFASSAAVYGNTLEVPTGESAPQYPLSPYGLSKQIGEGYLRLYRDAYGLSTTSLRFFNVYGSRQDSSSPYSGVISIFMDRMRSGQAPTIYGNGDATRDFIHVSDVVRACLTTLDTLSPIHNAYNVGRGQRVSLNELVDTLNQVLGTELQPTYALPRDGDIMQSGASIELLTELLGTQPFRTLKEGLSEML